MVETPVPAWASLVWNGRPWSLHRRLCRVCWQWLHMETFSFVCLCPRSSSTPCTVTSLASTLCRQMTSSVSAGASSKSSASLRLSSLLLLPTRTSRYSVQVLLLDTLLNTLSLEILQRKASPSKLVTLGTCDGQWKEIGTLWFLWETSTLGWDESCTLIVLSALSVINRTLNAVKAMSKSPDSRYWACIFL